MMKIKPKRGILLVKKHNQTALKSDIVVNEDEDRDKRLITGEVLNDGYKYKQGATVIFGRYALYKLTLKGEDFYFLDEEDVIGECNYKE